MDIFRTHFDSIEPKLVENLDILTHDPIDSFSSESNFGAISKMDIFGTHCALFDPIEPKLVGNLDILTHGPID